MVEGSRGDSYLRASLLAVTLEASIFLEMEGRS